MYSKKILKRFKNPKFAGEIKKADAIGQSGSVKCGDIMKIYLKVKEGKIKDIKFKTYGCVAAIVSSDVMCEIAKGKTIEEAEKITFKEIIEKMGGDVPMIKVHCSVLGTGALKNAIDNYKKNNEKY